MRLTVRVYPGSPSTQVGGRYGTNEPPILIVRVTARAVDGKANLAATRAVASAFGVSPTAAQIVAGTTQRTKILDVTGADPQRLETLLKT